MDEQVSSTTAVETAPPVANKGAKAFFADCWHNRTKRAISTLCICIVLILVATLFGSMIQTAGWSANVTELRNASTSADVKAGLYEAKTVTRTMDDGTTKKAYTVSGSVESGLLYVPKKASAQNKVPAIVFTHGLYNNREMQLQNVIEMVRRGYVVLALDYNGHGHNISEAQDASLMVANYGWEPYCFLEAAKYLYSLPYVDETKVGVSGHSMGGGATTNALALDGVGTTYNFDVSNGMYALLGIELPDAIPDNDAMRAKGFHLGIISAGLTQANDTTTQFGGSLGSPVGSNVLAAGVIKASSDEFFFNSTLKESAYVKLAKTEISKENFDFVAKSNEGEIYIKKGDKYQKVEKWAGNKQYYVLTESVAASLYMFSANAVKFVGCDPYGLKLTALSEYKVVNGGVYVNGDLNVAYQPAKQKEYRTWDTASGGKLINTVPVKSKLVSAAQKGAAIAARDANGNVTSTIRVIYEARETHPMNHFSIQSAAHVIDFFYNAFGVSPISSYKSAANQTWWLKEAFAILGIVGMFGLLLPVLDLLLGTKAFASLAAGEGEVSEGPGLLRSPRKHVSYWLSGILTAVFAGVSLKAMNGSKAWKIFGVIESMMPSWTAENPTKFIYNSTVSDFAAWGIVCAMFAVCITVVIWLINKALDTFLGDKLGEEAGTPFVGFKVRSWQNVIKTPIVAAIMRAVYYGVMNVIWKISLVDFRFWTFDLRVFDLIRVPAMLQYVPFFFLFYMVVSAFSINYRVKDLPEWATIAINVVANTIGVVILLWHANSYFIATGAQISTSSLFYIAAIPIIPCVGVATVLARRIYVRTGNAWLAGIVNAVLMTFFACANTSLAYGATPAWILG